MSLACVYFRVGRYVAASTAALITAAVVAAVLGDALPDRGGQTVVVIVAWAASVVAGVCLAATTVRLRVQAALWVVALLGDATAYGGIHSAGFARPLTLLVTVVSLVMAVVVVLVQADEAAAQPRDRF